MRTSFFVVVVLLFFFWGGEEKQTGLWHSSLIMQCSTFIFLVFVFGAGSPKSVKQHYFCCNAVSLWNEKIQLFITLFILCILVYREMIFISDLLSSPELPFGKQPLLCLQLSDEPSRELVSLASSLVLHTEWLFLETVHPSWDSQGMSLNHDKPLFCVLQGIRGMHTTLGEAHRKVTPVWYKIFKIFVF